MPKVGANESKQLKAIGSGKWESLFIPSVRLPSGAQTCNPYALLELLKSPIEPRLSPVFGGFLILESSRGQSCALRELYCYLPWSALTIILLYTRKRKEVIYEADLLSDVGASPICRRVRIPV